MIITRRLKKSIGNISHKKRNPLRQKLSQSAQGVLFLRYYLDKLEGYYSFGSLYAEGEALCDKEVDFRICV